MLTEIEPGRRPAGAALALSLCGALLLSSCDDPGTVAPDAHAGDSLTATVEGLVGPEEETFTVRLSRGDSGASTVTHGGYFQFSGIGYGLYILEVSGQGYGEYRRAVEVGNPHVLLQNIRLESVPWPLYQVIPSDSLVVDGTQSVARLFLRFSRTMDKSSVEHALEVEPAVPFALSWQTETENSALEQVLTLSFDPDDLRKDVAYTLALDTAARTLAGAHLERRFEYGIINHRGGSGGGGLASFPSSLRAFGPGESIPVYFSKAMDIASVKERLVLDPATGYRAEWDMSRNTLLLAPDTRWPGGGALEVRLRDGYKSLDGTVGGAVSGQYAIRGFGLENMRSGELVPLGDELAMTFNLPIDTATLRYRTSDSVRAMPLLAAPDRLLWTFSGTARDRSFTLIIDTLLSVYGDSLPKGTSVSLLPDKSARTFHAADSAKADAGIQPSRDSLSLSCSWSAYVRLRSSGFKLIPAFPVSTRWIPGEGNAVLKAWFPQPLPSASGFELVPADNALPADTLAFRTRPLAADFVRPFYGQERVRTDEAIVLRWNTLIDTAGFAAHVVMEPAAASVEIAQDTSGGTSTTVIRHADFAKGVQYRVRIGGVTDVFAAPLADTLDLRFRTSP